MSRFKQELTDKIVRSIDRYLVRNHTDMKKTINSFQQQFLTNSIYACTNILGSEDEGMELYATWNKGRSNMSEDYKDSKNSKLQSNFNILFPFQGMLMTIKNPSHLMSLIDSLNLLLYLDYFLLGLN